MPGAGRGIDARGRAAMGRAMEMAALMFARGARGRGARVPGVPGVPGVLAGPSNFFLHVYIFFSIFLVVA